MGLLEYWTKGESMVTSAKNRGLPPVSSSLPSNTMFRPELYDLESSRRPAVDETQLAHRSLDNVVQLGATLTRKDRELLELENEHHRLLNAYNALRTEKDGLIERTTDAEADAQALRTKVMTLQQELEACRDDLFRLQPLLQISDTEILKGYGSLSEQIQNWIDEEIRNFEKIHPEVPTDKFFLVAEHSDIARLLKKYPNTGEYLVRHRIHRCLQDHVLNKTIYLLGLPKDVTEALQAAEQSMAFYNPPRDFATINTWRSETLNALAHSSATIKNRDSWLQGLTTHLFESLSKVFPIIKDQHESMMSLYHQVMLPAAELAVKVQVSVSSYEFRPSLQRSPLHRVSIAVAHLQANKFVDIETNKTLKPDSAVVADKHGNIGQALIHLESGLVRLDGDKKSMELRKAIYLVQLNEPVRKRG